MAKKKVLKSQRLIHVKAESEIMSVNGLFPEDQVERLLTDFRDNFRSSKNKHVDDKLVVQTCVHNPTLF